jgi:SAM-dependent methyltransferase
MSEERHASAPPQTAGPGAPRAPAASIGADGAIDVALDSMETAEPPTEKTVSVKAPEPPSSQRAAGEASPKRARAKVTLKIPDDEVSRPQLTPSAPPAKAVDYPPPPEGPFVPMKPMRIISIESIPPPPPVAPPVAKASVPPPVQPRAPVAPLAPVATNPAPAPAKSPSAEDSWTPYQPTVADRAASAPLPPVVPRPQRSSQGSIPAAPIVPVAPAAPPRPDPSPAPPQAATGFVPPAPATSPMPLAPPTEPRSGSMDDILVVTDDVPPSSGEVVTEDERPTSPGASKATEPSAALANLPPVPVLAAAVAPSPPTPPTPPRVEAVPDPEDEIAPPVAPLPPAPLAAAAPVAPSPPAGAPVLTSATVAGPAGDAQINIKDLPPMRALAPTEPEGLEVHFEDEDPPISSPRNSEPEAEIALEDLVSVESAPSPTQQLAAKPLPPSETPTPARGFFPVGAQAASPPGAPPPGTPPSIANGPASSRVSPVPASAKPGTGPKVARVIVPTASPLAPPPMSESAPAGRRKARPWWEELFNDDFIRTMAKVSDEQIAKEVDFVEESLAVAKGAMLLDLGCGTGRHAIELTRRGYKVVGFDLSLPMLAKAAEEAQERNQKLNFVQGDMREMTFEDTFDGIYCWNTTFGFFEEEKNAQVIQRVHKALKKGGQFMLEVGNRDYIIRQAPSLAWFEGDGCICMDEMSIDWITSRMKVKRTMMMDDGRTKEIDYSVRIYSLHELGRILHESGFRVAEVSGRTGTPGVYFGNESPRTMILAEKK